MRNFVKGFGEVEQDDTKNLASLGQIIYFLPRRGQIIYFQDF